MTSPDELPGLLAGATSLPWTGVAADDYAIEADGYPRKYGGRFKEDGTGFYLATVGNHPADYGRANRDLIVAAVNALPTLLDRLTLLEAERERLREALGKWKCGSCGGSGEYRNKGFRSDGEFVIATVECSVCSGGKLNPIAATALAALPQGEG